MDKDELRHSIWRPKVELAARSREDIQCFATSLRHNNESNPVNQYNARVREACQAFNSTARPFVRDAPATATTTSLVSPTLHQEPISFKADELQVQVSARPSRSTVDSNPHQGPSASMSSSKLVHKQYNSPLEMYSMNNIRQTIEAQSELLAPGVKGINFMKSESPVNKQSEVYKLIKEEEEEEEEKRRKRQLQQNITTTTSNFDAARSAQNSSQSQQAEERIVHYASERTFASSAASSHQSGGGGGSSSSGNQTRGERSLAEAIQQSIGSCSNVNTHKLAPSDGNRKQPKCCECGQSIVGPFAKIEDRFVHPHCFNCSTCGTSLKNSGYFTISDKLYCDIHARQVANVMRLNYNFEPNKQTIDNTRQQYDEESTRRQQQVVIRHQQAMGNQQASERVAQGGELASQQPQQRQQVIADTQQRCSNCCVTLKNQSATISTMFSKKLGPDDCCACGRSGEIRMIWRPCQAQRQKEQLDTGSLATPSSSNVMQQHHHLQEQQQAQTRNKYQSRMVTNSSTVSTGGLPGGRAPVCCHCNLQIHGPYILAGKTIWCKPCSVTHFACSACHRSLLNVGFIEDQHTPNKYYCEHCFEVYLAPVCARCHIRIRDQDCLKALNKTWHTTCFVCTHCKCQFGNSSFYLEDDLPYCERDWNLLFTTKCFNCAYPIEAGDKWVEALERNYHSDCFRCAACQIKLEGSTFYCKGGKPYCRMHAR